MRTPSSRSGGPAPTPSTLRIIAGQWRGRKIRFPAVEGLRPTPDRVRETLFNWLAPVITEAHCLDLFAGSGALGLEALSRGAASTTFVDQSPKVKAALEENLQVLGSERGRVQTLDAIRWLQQATSLPNAFDVVFMDPPFRQELLRGCCDLLAQKALLKPDAYIYIEAEKELRTLPVPAHWELHRHKVAGQVQYALFICRE
jgi:16S rRNA (guanine966-N2)-methyltransferase